MDWSKVASLVFSDFWQKDRVQGTLKCGRKKFSRKIFFHCKLRIFVIWGNSLLPFACSFDYNCYKTISRIFWNFDDHLFIIFQSLLVFFLISFSISILYHQVGPLCIVLVNVCLLPLFSRAKQIIGTRTFTCVLLVLGMID